ncbi:ATP-binding cassette domain-containing protein [Henriciella mobilis]|uniref:ABC transporter ATP-binding protein n=1 Tax=Henriciella mobilis TaxID=2305467 RepID=UPI000E664376|nr:ATP-binding cassette domain-containing protein [Henriciella mobilis]RIJ14265.1 ATP-binding cassette domain-containing protein [Henriciella mobilis]RIJ19976.1 ATP-binding cassette domain-containing protein [Henriciella mobilis]
MAKVAIKVRDLRTSYSSHVVHEHLDMDVYEGEIVGVIGPSGSGKSVLLRAIVGLKKPDCGTVEVYGENVTGLEGDELREVQTLWGIMFQDGALFSNLTVRENVMAPMREHTDLSKPFMRQLADQKIRMAGLETSAGDKFPSDLSGGMRKRAALARALALDPPILFLDEPTAGLDPITAGAFDKLVRDLQQSLSLTVFLVTHDLDTLAATCDRIVALGDKRVVAAGTMDELRAMDQPWLQEYFGGPRGRAAAAGVK